MGNYAAGAGHRLCFKKEATWGTTQTGAGFTNMRHTGCDLDLAKSIVRSAEIRSDRMTADVRHGTWQPAGGISFELGPTNYDPLLEAALFGTWTTNVLKAGTTRTAFTFERGYTDQTTPNYDLFSGCMINTLALKLTPGQIVSVSMGLVAENLTTYTTSQVTSPTAMSTASPYDTFSGALVENAVALTSVTGLDINLNNNLDPKYVIGSKVTTGIPAGRAVVTGTLQCMFEDEVLFNKFVNETVSNLKFTLGGTEGATGTQTWFFPKIKFTSGGHPVQNDGVITQNVGFESYYDSTEGTSLKITRVP